MAAIQVDSSRVIAGDLEKRLLFGSSGFLVASRSHFKASAMEVDRNLKVPFVSESASGVLHPLDLGVDRFAGSLRYPVA